MKSILFSGESKQDLKLLIQLAERLGMKARLFIDEDKSMGKAIMKGRTRKIIDTNKFLNSLR